MKNCGCSNHLAWAALQSDAGAKLLAEHKVELVEQRIVMDGVRKAQVAQLEVIHKAELERRDATIAAYRQALEPFAKWSQRLIGPNNLGDHCLLGTDPSRLPSRRAIAIHEVEPVIGDLRKAEALLQSPDPGEALLKRHAEELAVKTRTVEACVKGMKSMSDEHAAALAAANKRAEQLVAHESDNLECGCYECLKCGIDMLEGRCKAAERGFDEANKRAEEAEAKLAELQLALTRSFEQTTGSPLDTISDHYAADLQRIEQRYNVLIRELEERARKAGAALAPFAAFYTAFVERPINGLDVEEIYGIHGGKHVEGGAYLGWDHVRQAAEVLAAMSKELA